MQRETPLATYKKNKGIKMTILNIVREDQEEKCPLLGFDAYNVMIPVYLQLDFNDGEFFANYLTGINRQYCLSHHGILTIEIDPALSGAKINELLDDSAEYMQFLLDNHTKNPESELEIKAMAMISELLEITPECPSLYIVSEGDLIEYMEDNGYHGSTYASKDDLEYAVAFAEDGDDENYMNLNFDEIEKIIRADWYECFRSNLELSDYVLNELLKCGDIDEDELAEHKK
jgi:hypothetical protein